MIRTKYKSNNCGELNLDKLNEEVTLSGWVACVRDLGGLIFVELRDRSGLFQLVSDPQINPQVHKIFESLRSEFVITVKGKVTRRPEETYNEKYPTGQVEMYPESIEVLSEAKTLPFVLDDESVSEEIRLRYRYLDMRSEKTLNNMVLRHNIVTAARNYLNNQSFLEIETPILINTTPEGARDYLVPSRVHEGKFYALPQSPQIFKQLLMVGGIEKYYQIAKCFRDEDLRADRQPEFTQIDLEMSFVEQQDVIELVEGLLEDSFKAAGVEIKPPFIQITHDYAMERFGSDKPDTRFGLELFDITDIMQASTFEAFKGVIADGGIVRAIRIPGIANYSRKDMDDVRNLAISFGAKGLAWVTYMEDGEVKSPVFKFLTEEQIAELQTRSGAQKGDIVFFVADKGTRPNEQAGYYTIGEIEGAAQIGIVEGVATAGTVHEAAGIPIVTAFNAGNLPRVYQAIREAYPAAEIFIFADNDAASEAAGNQNAGQIAAQKTGLHDKYIISPPRDFAVIGKDCSDWNDYARENGTDTARKAIRAAMRRTTMNAEQIRTLEYFQNLPAPTLERMTEKAQRRGEGLDLGLMFYNSIGYPEPLRITGFTLIGARTSGGKTSLVTNLTARILQKDPDKKILFLSFEESEDSIFCRILAAYLYNTIGEGDPHISVREVGEAIRDSRAYRGFSQENERKWERIFTAAETIAPRVRIIDLMDRPPIGDVARADICRRLIEEARRDWEQETVICIDYIQKLKAQDSSAQGYRAFKSIMEELQPLIADGALILAAAQFNRTAATANAGDIAGEFWGAYAEQIREAADIEQAAEMIIYCVVDNNAVPDPVMNLRLLKNRRGSRELSAGIPVRFVYGGLNWDEIGQTTLQNPAGYTRTANANGTGKTYSRPTGNAALCDTKKGGSKK